jgi:hypothetical protein
MDVDLVFCRPDKALTAIRQKRLLIMLDGKYVIEAVVEDPLMDAG